MPNTEISNTDTISFRQFVSKLPVFLTGIPDRAKGIYIAAVSYTHLTLPTKA